MEGIIEEITDQVRTFAEACVKHASLEGGTTRSWLDCNRAMMNVRASLAIIDPAYAASESYNYASLTYSYLYPEGPFRADPVFLALSSKFNECEERYRDALMVVDDMREDGAEAEPQQYARERWGVAAKDFLTSSYNMYCHVKESLKNL